MNGYGWHRASAELAELVRTVGPRVALVGTAFLVLVVVPMIMRFWVYFSRVVA